MNQPTTTATTISPTTTTAGLQCITGRFNLLFFIQQGAQTQIFPPVGGDVIGQIQPLTGGNPIPVIQTRQINIPLSQVDNQIVTLCGVFTVRQGRVVLDVRFVQRFTPTTFPPQQQTTNLLLLLLLLGLLGSPFGKFGKGLGGLGTSGGLGTLGGLGGLGGLGTLGGLGGLGTLGSTTTGI